VMCVYRVRGGGVWAWAWVCLVCACCVCGVCVCGVWCLWFEPVMFGWCMCVVCVVCASEGEECG
jgi:hypothetical protein